MIGLRKILFSPQAGGSVGRRGTLGSPTGCWGQSPAVVTSLCLVVTSESPGRPVGRGHRRPTPVSFKGWLVQASGSSVTHWIFRIVHGALS